MSSLDCKGGGLIGALLAWPLYKALDVWGGMIVLIFATAIVLMAMTGFSFGGIGMRMSEWVDDFRVEMQERREEKDALRDARQEEELERENALAIERQKRRQERLQKQKEEQEAAAKEAAKGKAPTADEEIRPALEAEDTGADRRTAKDHTAQGKADAHRGASAGRRDGRTTARCSRAARRKRRRAAQAQEISDERAALHRAGRRIYPRARGRAYAHNAEPPQQLHHAGSGKRVSLRHERRPAYAERRLSTADGKLCADRRIRFSRRRVIRADDTAADARIMRRTEHTVSRRGLCADRRIRSADAIYAPTEPYSQPTNEEPTVEPDVSADAYAEEDDDEELYHQCESGRRGQTHRRAATSGGAIRGRRGGRTRGSGGERRIRRRRRAGDGGRISRRAGR